MKAQILKLAGVKTEKEFYKKYPTEEAFMKKHGNKLKKAFDGGYYIPGAGYSEDIKAIGKYVKKTNKENALTMLANQAGPIIGLSQGIADKYGKESKQLDQSIQMGNLANKAASSRTSLPQAKLARPEDQRIQPINPLGVQGFGYFEDGGEIQNTYAPNDMYLNLGYTDYKRL